MPQTANFGFPYPALTDSPNIPLAVENLAGDLDEKMQWRPVGSVSEIVNPYQGQIVYDNVLKVYYMWDSGAWKFFGAFNRTARYYNTNTSEVPLANNQAVPFDTMDKETGLITPSGAGNTTFTINVDCHARVNTSVRFGQNPGFPYIFVLRSGGNMGGAATANSNGFQMVNMSTDFDINAGQAIEVRQNGTTIASEGPQSQSFFISITLEPR